MKVTKFLSSYLRASDVTGPVTVTIAKAVEEEIGKEGETESKLVLYFKELEQGLIPGKTVLNEIVRILGSDDTDEWVGRKFVLYNDPNVFFSGKRVGGIRVRELN